jgi:uncharacterized protein involved in exopolysaccharide biosynthesis
MKSNFHWQDYAAIIIRRRWFFAIPCFLVVISSIVYSFFLPRIYRAETVLLVRERQVMNPLIRGLAVSTSIGQRMRIIREELLSWTSLSRLVNELGMDRHAQSPIAFEQLIKRLQRDIYVRMRGHDLLTISYEDEDPKLAQKLVNTITQIYMERNIESMTAESETAISFLQSELDVYRKQLEEAELRLREFRELYEMQMPVAMSLNQQIISLEVQLQSLLVENTELHPRVVDIKRQINELKKRRNDEIRRMIASALAKGQDASAYSDIAKALEQPVEAMQDNPRLLQAREAYEQWVQRLDNPGQSPVVPVAVPQVQVVTTTEGEGTPTQGFEIIGGSSATSISLGPRQQQELQKLTRDYQVSNQNYQNLLARLERAKITQRLDESEEGTKFKILEPARLPLRPVRPNKIKILFFSLFLGFFVGAAVAFVAEFLDQSFQNADELETVLELPVLGTISTIVTEDDLAAQQRRRKHWLTFKAPFERIRDYVLRPAGVWVERLLVKWRV